MRVRISGNGDVKSDEREMSETCRMAEQSYDKGKLLIVYNVVYAFIHLYCLIQIND